MTNTKLLKQIEQWHENGKHKEIENAVQTILASERDYDLTCMLARALNNLSRYEQALWLLESVREQGQTDALWHFRIGYSLYYLDREAEAVPRFETAIKLGDDHPDTYQMLLWAQKAAKQHKTKAGAMSPDVGKQFTFTPKAIATLELNMRLHPEARTERIEDGLDLMLRSKALGYVNGGDSRRTPEGEIESCSIEIKLADDSDKTRMIILAASQKLDAAKGSKLKYRSLADDGAVTEHSIGKLEGFALYIKRNSLPEEVYKNHSVNEVVNALHDILGKNGTLVFSYWNGPEEIALYFYGEGGVEDMLVKAKPFIDGHPLCENCRIVRIA